MIDQLSVTRSRSGTACLWEEGGGLTNTGQARVIADSSARPKRALYIRRRGILAGAQHALVPVEVGDLVIDADHHRGDFRIAVHRITGIEGEAAQIKLVAEFGEGEWRGELAPDGVLDERVQPAVDAAVAKAQCWHCREPHFALES